jgi:hypothetical protein
MASHDEPAFNNTIRMWIKKSPNEYAASFMHPTAYSAYHLSGCAATYNVLDEYGVPQVETNGTESAYDKSIEETGKVLDDIFQVYQDFDIGDRNGTFSGNDFFMKTDSEVNDSVIDLKKKELPTIAKSTTSKIIRQATPNEDFN